MTALVAIPIDQPNLPPDLLEVASALANLIRISCPGVSAVPAATGLAAPSSSADASAPETGATPADRVAPTARSTQHLGRIVAIGLSAILIVAVAVCFGLLRRRLRGAR
jgi:hypothetical protein